MFLIYNYCSRREIDTSLYCWTVSIQGGRSRHVSNIIITTVLEERSYCVSDIDLYLYRYHIESLIYYYYSRRDIDTSLWYRSVSIQIEISCWVSDLHLLLFKKRDDVESLIYIYYCCRREIDTSIRYRSVSIQIERSSWVSNTRTTLSYHYSLSIVLMV